MTLKERSLAVGRLGNNTFIEINILRYIDTLKLLTFHSLNIVTVSLY